MLDSDEHILFLMAQEGERTAFDHLQKLLDMPVRHYIYRLINRSEEEDEIVQDVFLSLYTNLKRIRSANSLRPFLFRIVRNRCFDALRARRQFRSVSFQNPSTDVAFIPAFLIDQYPQPDEAVYWKMIHADVQKAIDLLAEPHRQVFILYYEEHFTYDQIGEALGIDVGTVKSRLHYGKRTLLKQLSPEVRAALSKTS